MPDAFAFACQTAGPITSVTATCQCQPSCTTPLPNHPPLLSWQCCFLFVTKFLPARCFLCNNISTFAASRNVNVYFLLRCVLFPAFLLQVGNWLGAGPEPPSPLARSLLDFAYLKYWESGFNCIFNYTTCLTAAASAIARIGPQTKQKPKTKTKNIKNFGDCYQLNGVKVREKHEKTLEDAAEEPRGQVLLYYTTIKGHCIIKSEKTEKPNS